MAAGLFEIRNSIIFGNASNFSGDDDGIDEQMIFMTAGWNNQVVDPDLANPLDRSNPDFRPNAGSPARGAGADPPDDGFFTTGIDYIGGVDPDGEEWYRRLDHLRTELGWRMEASPVPDCPKRRGPPPRAVPSATLSRFSVLRGAGVHLFFLAGCWIVVLAGCRVPEGGDSAGIAPFPGSGSSLPEVGRRVLEGLAGR